MEKFTADRDGNIRKVEPKSDPFSLDLSSIPIFNPEASKDWVTYGMKKIEFDTPNYTGDFHIVVRIVENHHRTSHFEYSDGAFQIYVDKNQVQEMGGSIDAVLIHEMGHVIAAIGGLPYNRVVMESFNFSMTHPDAVLEREEEAWAVADKLYARTKQIGLDSYRRIRNMFYGAEEAGKTIYFGEKP